MECSLILLDAPLGLAADFDRCAHDLMPVTCKSIQPNILLGHSPDAAWVNSCTPATAESVQITATNTAVRDFDINVRLFPSLGLVALPFHFALGGTGVKTQPSLKLVRGAHGCSVKRAGGLICVKLSSMAEELLVYTGQICQMKQSHPQSRYNKCGASFCSDAMMISRPGHLAAIGSTSAPSHLYNGTQS